MNGMKPKGRVDTNVLEELVAMLNQQGMGEGGETQLTEDDVVPLGVSAPPEAPPAMGMEKRCPTCGQPMGGMHGATATNDAQ